MTYMWYLIDPHQYFEQRNGAPFFNAIVPVFLIGGLSFITTIANVVNISTSRNEEGLVEVVGYISDGWVVYSFLSPFIRWFVVGLLLYGFTMWFGTVGVDVFTSLNFGGIGFTPLVFSGMLDASVSVYYSFFTPLVPVEVSISPVTTGVYGWLSGLTSGLVFILCLLWSVHIWIGASHQLGGVTPRKSTLISIAIGGILVLERVVVSLV